MLKDIFIDNNIAKNFCNPVDPEYKSLIKWLISDSTAYLVVSQKLLVEYVGSTGQSPSLTNITVIIDRLKRDGRIIKISNEEIKEFKRQKFTSKIVKKFTCNKEDQEHIPVVLLSHRKYVLTLDQKFTFDLLNFPKFKVIVCDKPQDLPYDK
jgi:hypothetical protein